MGLWRGVRDLSPSAVKKGVSFRNLTLKAVFCVFRFFCAELHDEFFREQILNMFRWRRRSAMCFASGPIFGNKKKRYQPSVQASLHANYLVSKFFPGPHG